MSVEGPFATSDATAQLAVVRAAAELAGAAILAIAGNGPAAAWAKADASPLTAADLAANAILVAALRELEPATLIISEEEPCTYAQLPRRFWLVDPLDGTREFVAGSDEYTVNVALVENGVPVLGVVHAPALGVTYAAARGCGSTRAGADGVRTIGARAAGPLTVLTSRSHPSAACAAFLAALPPHALVEMGSSLKLCLVADGTAQLYPRFGPTCWWDTAAGHAIALESGATVTAFDGAPLRYEGLGTVNPAFICSALPHLAWAAAAGCTGALS